MLDDDAELHVDLDTSAQPRQQGRPRDASRDTVILEAALALVGEVGYDRVSMDAVAARARASKATIYRRWCSKGALVAAAVRCRASADVVLPDEGSLRADLVATLRILGETMGQQDLGLLTGIFAGMRTDPDLADAMRCDLLADKVALTTPMFQRAAARNEPLRPDASLLFHEVVPAVLMHRLMVVGLPVDDAFAAHIVDDVLLPIFTSPALRPASHAPEGPHA